jgi:hypothetical protein
MFVRCRLLLEERQPLKQKQQQRVSVALQVAEQVIIITLYYY